MTHQTVTHHEDGIIQIKSPLPFPLRWVNSYLIRGRDGYTLIDPGLHTEDNVSQWSDVLNELDVLFTDVKQIVLTHHHPDHYGLAGWFQARTGAPVYMTEIGKRQADLLWGEGQPLTDEIYRLFVQHGMDREASDAMIPHMNGFVARVSPPPAVTMLRAGEEFALGDEMYETIHTPGHASGHLCFYSRDRGRLFCGDHVLPQISPNVSYIPGIDANPLHSFLSSLLEVSKLDVRIAFPGHRDPFEHFSRRCLELIDHHHDRLAKMESIMVEPMTAYDVCRKLFGDRLSVHQLRFAMAETLAHVVYLEEEQRIRANMRNDGVWLYETSR